jgi:hypothetical protein
MRFARTLSRMLLRVANQAVAVWRKLWRLGMGFEAIEHVSNFLALVGCKSGYVNQRLHAFGTRQGYDRTGIGVSRQYDRPFGAVQAAVESSHIIGKRCERKRRPMRRWRSPESLLLPIAEALARFVCEEHFANVKACEGHSCTLVFADRTRRRARRWCSMAVCGNRAKQAAHRKRLKNGR